MGKSRNISKKIFVRKSKPLLVWLAMCLVISNLFTLTVQAAALPDSTQTFSGYSPTGTTMTSPDGYFVLKASAGELAADQYGAFINDNVSNNGITSYLEIAASNDLKSFELKSATVGEYVADLSTANNFTNVYLVGYANDVIVAQTTSYNSTNGYEENYAINYSPFNGKRIDSFRVYYTAASGTKQTAFNLVDFTIANSSTTPPAPAAPSVSADDAANVIVGLDTTMEFKVDDGSYVKYNGSNTPDLSGDHNVLVRVAANGGAPAGAEATLTFTTNPAAPAAPSVSADDAANVIVGLDTTMEFKVDSGSYVKYNGSNAPELSGDHTVLVRVAANGTTGAPAGAEATLTFTTNPAAPAAPSVSADDAANVIVGLDTTMEFKVDSGSYVKYNGSNAPELSGDHTVLVRVAANGTTGAPAGAEAALTFTTNPAAPAAPSVSADDAANVIVGLDTTMEFKVDSGSYVKYNGSNAPELSGNHTVLVRVAANGGTPAGSEATLTFTANPESTPSATIDYANEQLSNLTPNGAYEINGTAVTADGTGKLAIETEWLGTTLSIVKTGNGTTTVDSSEQPVVIPSRPATPTGVGKTDESYPGAGNGELTGVTNALEYKASTSSNWTSISGTTVSELTPGAYEVRVKATETAFASEPVTVTVSTTPATPESTPSVTIDYANEQLSNLTPNGAYEINGTAVTADGTGKLAIETEWLGTTLSIVKTGNGTTTVDSSEQPVVIPSRPATPTGVGKTDESYPGAGNGELTGVTNALEYKASTSSNWTSISGTTVSELTPGAYEVRVKATETAFASEPVTVTVSTTPATPESTPSVTIDYANEQLSNLTPNGAYEINGTAVTADGTGKLAIETEWLGTTLSIVKTGNGTTTVDSSEQPVVIPSRPATPTGVGKTDESYPGAGNGELTGVTNALEYKASTSSNWTSISGTTVSELTPGAYEVRVKATETAFASEPVTVTVSTTPATPESTPSVTIDYANEQLSNLTPNGAYEINGTAVTADGTGKLAIETEWLGTTLSIVKTGNGTTTVDSSEQPVVIPSRPATPTGVGKTDESYPGAGNGELTGVTNALEYKASTSSNWTSISGTTVSELTPGAYEVRVKATETAFASEPVTVTVSTTPATPESTPSVTIDYANEQLSNLTPNGAYEINGTAVTADGTGKLAIETEWLGTTLSIVKTGNGTTTVDSSEQPVVIPSRPATPTGVGKTDESYPGAGNGELTGVTNALEYKASTSSNWTSISGTTVDGLTPGAYEVRVKATETAFASTPVNVTVSSIPATPESTPSATIDYANEQLSNLTPNGAYEINGTAVTVDGTGKLTIEAEWLGTTLSIVKIGNGTTTLDSSIQTVVIPVRPAAPEVTANDLYNTIVNLDTSMEFSIDGTEYVKFSGSNNPNLTGTHSVKVRLAATDSQLAGEEILISFTPNPLVSVGNDQDDLVEVWVNGKPENAGKAHTEVVNGVKQTTVVVDPAKLQQKLDTEGNHVVVTIAATAASNVIVGELTGQMIKNMQNLDGTLVLQTDKGSYTLPSSQIDIDSIASQFDGQLSDLVVSVTIAETTPTIQQVANAAATKGDFTIVAPPIEFTVTVTHAGKTVQINQFNVYVERTVELPAGINPNQITTGLVVEADGTVRHVPTQVKNINGKYYAVINSLTNSTYTVVWHPITFADVEQHWAKDAVNDMGSRLIVNGVSETMFNPDADITRAEFAAIVVRGLGLKLGQGANPFLDVASNSWYESAIQTAASYGLITGFEDGTFRPNAKITREQAMLIFARAMKLTGLAEKTGEADPSLVLSPFTDSASIAAWAKNDVAFVVKAELIKGRNGKLGGNSSITRAEVATIIQRLLQQSDLI